MYKNGRTSYYLTSWKYPSISIDKFSLSGCLFVCLYPINVKTAESSENPRNFFPKIREIFCFCYLLTRRTHVYFISNKFFYKWNKRWARSALKAQKEGRDASWISSMSYVCLFYIFFDIYNNSTSKTKSKWVNSIERQNLHKIQVSKEN